MVRVGAHAGGGALPYVVFLRPGVRRLAPGVAQCVDVLLFPDLLLESGIGECGRIGGPALLLAGSRRLDDAGGVHRLCLGMVAVGADPGGRHGAVVLRPDVGGLGPVVTQGVDSLCLAAQLLAATGAIHHLVVAARLGAGGVDYVLLDSFAGHMVHGHVVGQGLFTEGDGQGLVARDGVVEAADHIRGQVLDLLDVVVVECLDLTASHAQRLALVIGQGVGLLHPLDAVHRQIVPGGVQQVVIQSIERDTIPGPRRAVIVHVGQIGAIRKSSMADIGSMVSDGDFRQPRATVERILSDACHTVRDGDGGHARAVGKRQIANVGDPILQRYCQGVSAADVPGRIGITVDGPYAGPLCQTYIGYAGAAFESVIIDRRAAGHGY